MKLPARSVHHRATCPICGKQGYHTRRGAKEAARVFHPGERLSVYRCGEFWHFGHLPDKARRGRWTPPSRRRVAQ